MDKSLAVLETIAMLASSRANAKSTMRSHSAAIAAQHRKWIDARDAADKADAIASEEEEVLTELLQRHDYTNQHLVLSVLHKIVSGRDPRPMVWMDPGKHAKTHNTIEVRRLGSSIEFSDPVLAIHWKHVRHLFEISEETMSYPILAKGKDNYGKPSNWTLDVPVESCNIFTDMNQMCHSFISMEAAHDKVVDKEVTDSISSDSDCVEIDASDAKRGTITYHWIKLSLKTQPEPQSAH